MARMFSAVTLDTEGHFEHVWWPITDDGTLPHLQRAVGGLVDVVALGPDLDMWLNEEAIILGYPVNRAATRIAADYLGDLRQDLYGPVVFTGGADDEGETSPIRPGDAAELLARDELTVRCCDCGRRFADTHTATQHWEATHDATVGADPGYIAP